MILVRSLLPAMTSRIATMRSLLQASISSAKLNLSKREGCSWALHIKDSNSEASTVSSRVVEWKSGIKHDKSRIRGDESTAYTVLNESIVDVLSPTSDTFWIGSKTLDLVTCLIF